MRLSGSITENGYYDQLTRSWESIKAGNGGIMKALESHFHEITSAFVLGCTPEQSEDIYTILVNGQDIVTIEISRPERIEVSFSTTSLRDYKRQAKSRQRSIQLAVALALSKSLIRP